MKTRDPKQFAGVPRRRRKELEKLAALPDGRVWRTTELKGWGNSLTFHRRNDEGHRWVGWLPVKPEPGDLIEHMTSAGLARFKVLEIKTVSDPDDMFWALTPHFGRLVES